LGHLKAKGKPAAIKAAGTFIGNQNLWRIPTTATSWLFVPEFTP
jgi:hypothetical protein